METAGEVLEREDGSVFYFDPPTAQIYSLNYNVEGIILSKRRIGVKKPVKSRTSLHVPWRIQVLGFI